MGIKLFCGKPRKDEHEWHQLKEICKIINEYYDKTKPIYLLYNFDLTSRCQIDLLILQEKGISILELKSIKGEVIGNTNRDENWSVNTESGKVDLPVNLFVQISKEGSTLRTKLEQLRKRIFPNIEEEDMKKLQCWGYFQKGSTFDINQIPAKYHKWFDVITGDHLINKLSFVDADYKLDEKDMIAIKDYFKLGECPEDDPELSFLFIEKLEEEWLPKLKNCAIDYHQKIKNEMIEKGEIKDNGDWILNLKSRIFEDGKVSTKPGAVKSINDILKLSKYSIITGFAGTGKSVLLHQFYEKIILNETQYRIPLFVSLREIQQYKNNEQVLFNYKNNELIIPSEKDLGDKFLLEISKTVVYSYFENLTKDEDLIKRKEVYLVLFEKLLKENYFVFCLDGYDEITTSKNLVDNWIGYLFRENNSFLLTTRPIVLTRLQKILGTQGLHYYWLLLPTKQETREYLETRAKKLGFTSSEFNYKNLTPMQLHLRSLFPIKLILDENQESEFQIYGSILWEEFKNNLSIISRIESSDDITKLLKSTINDKLGVKYSIYDLINGPIERKFSKTDFQKDASILGTCSELAYLSYSSKIDSEYVEKIYKENPYSHLFVEIVTLPELTNSFIYFIKPQLKDYFVNHYIYSMYKQGKMVPLINSDIMKMFHKFLENKKPWEHNAELIELGKSADEIIVNYLIANQIELRPTKHLPPSGEQGHLLIMGRFSMGVPKWYENLIQGIVNEIVNEKEASRIERLSNGLLEIIQKIPEVTLDHAYDPIIKDIADGSTSISIYPDEYTKIIKNIFPEFDVPLVNHIKELFDSLNRLPKSGVCKACEIEKEIEEKDKKTKDIDFSIEDEEEDEDIDKEIDYLLNLSYTFHLTHEINGNPTQTYLLNLLESDIDDRIKNWAIIVNEFDSIYSFQGLLRHRADFTDEDYLQYLAYKLIEVSKTPHLALYAITIWESLLKGMGTDGGGWIPGPEMNYDYTYEAISSLLKKDKIWDNIISYLYSKVIHSDDYKKFGNLLFETIKEYVSDELYMELTLRLISNVKHYRDESISNQLDCLKGYEDYWLPILLNSKKDGLVHLSDLDLDNYNLTSDDLEEIHQEIKKFIDVEPPRGFNPQILVYLHKKGFAYDWKDFVPLLGQNKISDAYFRRLITDIDENNLIQVLEKLDETEEKLKVVLISRKNQKYLEEFLNRYLLGKSILDTETIFHKWIIDFFKDTDKYLSYTLVNHCKIWLFEEIQGCNFLIKILSNKAINLERATEIFTSTEYFYGYELVNVVLYDEFWDDYASEEIIENLFEKMIDSVDGPSYKSQKYWIKNLLQHLDRFPNLDNLAFEYISKLIKKKFVEIGSNDLLYYYNENPHTKFKEIFLKAIESLTTKQEINNTLIILKYRISNLERKGIFEKKKIENQFKEEIEYLSKIIDILIDKDLDFLKQSIYSEIDYSNFELIDLASKTRSSKLNDYATQVVKNRFTNYQIDKILEIIEKYCNAELLTTEIKNIEKQLQNELEEQKKKNRKWRFKSLEKSITKCKKLLENN
ncbi:MAG: NACHT domain-containing protein [Candidatus Heimdallarchaeota archaeon]